MSTYSFERLSILLVEDNIYIRDILENTLRHLGFGSISTAANGQEAIEFLRLAGSNPTAAGVMGVDMILTDLVMSPINGLLLLQWVRSSRESYNRFMPVMMISGAADRDHVRAARDRGVTEFIAKPFSVQALYQRFMAVIERPRPFILSHDYFGPDRRRRNTGPVEGAEERRRKGTDHITEVYSTDKVVKPKSASDAWVFRLPNTLREKAGGAGFKGTGSLPADLLEKAEEQLEHDSMDFADWALGYLSRLSNLCTDALLQPGVARRRYLEEINLLAHELRGQGGTFGYPLITIFAKSLYETTQPGCREDDTTLEIVKAHIDSMRAVIRERVSGDGGAVGRELLKSLQAAIKRLRAE